MSIAICTMLYTAIDLAIQPLPFELHLVEFGVCLFEFGAEAAQNVSDLVTSFTAFACFVEQKAEKVNVLIHIAHGFTPFTLLFLETIRQVQPQPMKR
jgi:hypothetical protein